MSIGGSRLRELVQKAEAEREAEDYLSRVKSLESAAQDICVEMRATTEKLRGLIAREAIASGIVNRRRFAARVSGVCDALKLAKFSKWISDWIAKAEATKARRLSDRLGAVLVHVDDELKQFQKRIDGPSDDLQDKLSAANDLATLIETNQVLRFVVPARLDSSGGIDLTRLRNGYVEQRGTMNCEGAVVPFTTEREPNTLGSRSGFILIFLGLLMLFVSTVTWSWMPVGDASVWIPWHESGRDPKINDVRESLVAVLLVFPAALYGLFFQSRPRSAAGQKSQLGTFTALSLLFALPVLPAAILAVGGSLMTASQVLVAVGLAAIAAGAAGLVVFLPGRLLALRAKVVKSAPPRSTPEEQKNKGKGY